MLASDEFLIWQRGRYHEIQNRHSEEFLIPATVEPEAELCEVAVQVFYAHLVEAAYHAAFEQRPKILD